MPQIGAMRILEYTGLDATGVAAQYRKATEAIAREDFRAAEVKKLVNLGHGKFYRARLDGANRLLFALVRHGGETCALMLEVIENHDYAKSRFLRGASIDETKIVEVDAKAAQVEAQPVRYLHPDRSAVHFLDKPLSSDDAQESVYRLPPPLIVVGSAGRKPRFFRTANSSSPSACPRDARRAGASFRAGLRACARGTLSRKSMGTRLSRKSAG
jgi:hypothetical protein